MSPDVINGIFELVGGLFLLLNCYKIYQDKQLKGVSWLPTFFFTSWGLWNLFYYPTLDQWFSFVGGCVLVVVNTLWLWLIFFYSGNK